ncbi:MAG: efflux RND transporter periplasmic adaptor subunit [Bacteroidales bacterium]
MKKLEKRTLVIYLLVLLTGLFAGWLLFGTGQAESPRESDQQQEQALEEVDEWTCSMHPQVRQEQPGDCPICGMDLIPVGDQGQATTDDPFLMTLSEGHAQWANIHTSVVESSTGGGQLTMTGQVGLDERRTRLIAATFPGRIEQLSADFTGQVIRQGQRLARIYSPELMQAQQELIIASRNKEQQPRLYRAARGRLELFNLTEAQIDQIEESGEASPEMNIYATLSGFLTSREVSQGDYVSTGQTLFEVASLETVWVELDAYENQISLISEGDSATVTVPARGGRQLEARVEFVDPVINRNTRTASVRLTVNNAGNLLKPGMFVNATIMNEPREGAVPVIPQTAILWTGERSLVYVKVPGTEGHTFEFREIETGARSGEQYQVVEGLNIGEEIAVNGVFAIDAAAQLKGSYSMMSPPGVVDLPEPFKSNLEGLFSMYFDLKNALADDDADAAAQHGEQLNQQLEVVEEHALQGEHHMFWMGQHAAILEGIDQFIEAGDIEQQRVHFEPLSEAFIETARTLGAIGETWYVAYCPMVDDNRGAYWLSEFQEILNPYFGAMMLRCGEVREMIRPGVGAADDEPRVMDVHVH